MNTLPGLFEIAWDRLSHAYGSAEDVPDCINGLLSKDETEFDDALCELSSNIYHQGDVFDSTAATIPFLIKLADLLESNEILGLIKAIAQSATIPERETKRVWLQNLEKYPKTFTKEQVDRNIERKIKSSRLVLSALINEADGIKKMMTSSNTEISNVSKEIVDLIG